MLAFAKALEDVASATYGSFMPIFTTPVLRQATMTVGAVEARHSAIIPGLLTGAQPAANTALFAPPSSTTSAAPTTVASGPTTTAAAEAPTEYQVPGPFESLVPALGPNSYIYAHS